MKKEKKPLTRKRIKIQLFISLLFFVAITLGVILLMKYKEKQEESPWENKEEFVGGIIISTQEEEKEVIPENIFDEYGLEYEFVKIPYWGISTYMPVGWKFTHEKDFLYFTSMDEDGEYKNAEIALCTMNVENFYNKKDIMRCSYYIERNLRNHCFADNGNYVNLIIATCNNNTSYEDIKDEKGNLIGYELNPYVTFADEDDPIFITRNEYGIHVLFHYLNTNHNYVTFSSVVGQKGYKDQLDAIGRIIKNNTKSYANTKFDDYEFNRTKLQVAEVGNMFYRVIDSEYVERNSDKWTLSTNVKSLAFNSILQVRQQRATENIEDVLTEKLMIDLWRNSNEVIKDSYMTITEKDLEIPYVRKIVTEDVSLFNKRCKIITWTVDAEINSTIRHYVNAIMPATFTTYIIPDKDNVYLFTINYTHFQKSSALEFMKKMMSLSGFSE